MNLKHLITLLPLFFVCTLLRAQYCTPNYSIGTADGDYIDSVAFGGVAHATGGDSIGYYYDYTNLVGTHTLGNCDTVYVLNQPIYPENISVWVDVNQNQVFDANERLGTIQSVSGGVIAKFPIELPPSTPSGNFRLRIKMNYFVNENQYPCGNNSYGEVEDYLLQVTNPHGPTIASTYVLFDGGNDRIDINNLSLPVQTNTTIEFWFNPFSIANDDRLLSSRNASQSGLGLSIAFFNQKLEWASGPWYPTTNAIIPVNEWTHFALVIDGATATSYVNGVQGSTHGWGAAWITPLSIGSPFLFTGGSFGNHFHGAIDEFRIWDKSLSNSEIQALMGSRVSVCDLLLNYTFEQGVCEGANASNSIVMDDSDNGNTGTMQNFSLTGSVSNYSCSFANCGSMFPPVPLQSIISSHVVSNTNDQGSGSLRDRIACASPGDTITFSPTLYGDSIFISSQRILIDKGVTILSPHPDSMTIYTNSRELFEVSGGHTDTVRFVGLTLKGGDADGSGGINDHGGAIASMGIVSISNCRFIDNFASSDGGAIYQNGGFLKVEDCLFQANFSSTSSQPSDGLGGAIYSNALGQIRRCDFISNRGHGGGAIYQIGNAMEITDCYFYDNSSFLDGGAIYCISSPQFEINSSRIHENYGRGGGGIYVNGSTFTLAHSDIYFNHSTALSGGGILFAGSTIADINYCRIDSNQSSDEGGGIFVGGTTTLTLNSDTIGNNHADDDGGGITNARNTIINSCLIQNNSAVDAGGGVMNNDDLEINNSIIEYNETFGTGGGGLYNQGSRFVIKHSQISHNTSNNNATDKGQGAGIFVGSTHTAQIDTCIISNNLAVRTGGGIYIGVNATCLLTGDTLRGNTALIGGGGIHNRNINYVNYCVIDSNNAADGGGIFDLGEILDINFSTISYNNATSSVGGGIYHNGSSGVPSLKINHSSIIHNSAINQGGGIDSDGKTILINGCDISYNSSTRGGGLFCTSVGGGFIIDRTSLNRNYASVHGGAIYNRDSLIMTYCTVAENVAATGNGGAMYLRGNNVGYKRISRSTIVLNQGVSGGGIVLADDGLPLNFDLARTILAKNEATSGNKPDISKGPIAVCNLLGWNLIGNEDGSNTFTIIGGSNQIGSNANPIDPIIDTLAYNGGLGETVALLCGSPAINAAGNISPTTDQRGVSISGAADIGAFEVIGNTAGLVSLQPENYPSDDYVDVSWQFPPDTLHTGFELYRNGQLFATLNASDTMFTDSFPDPGFVNKYRVQPLYGVYGKGCMEYVALGRGRTDAQVSGHVENTIGIDVPNQKICIELDNQLWDLDEYGDGGTINLPGSYTDFGWEAWIKPDTSVFTSFVSTLFMFANTSTYEFILFGISNGNLEVHLEYGSQIEVFSDTTTNLMDGNWHHVALSKIGNIWIIYIDGVQKLLHITSSPFPLNVTLQDMAIGHDLVGLNYDFYYGQIDEIRCWNIPINPVGLSESMFRTLSGTEANLLAYFNFDHPGINTLPYQAFNLVPGTNSHMTFTYSPFGSPIQTIIPNNTLPLKYCAVTDANGNYTLPNIPYRRDTSFHDILPSNPTGVLTFDPPLYADTFTVDSNVFANRDFIRKIALPINVRVENADDVSTDSVTITWDYIDSLKDDISGFEIYVNGGAVDTVNSGFDTTYTYGGIEPGVFQNYSIRAFRDVGFLDYSDFVFVPGRSLAIGSISGEVKTTGLGQNDPPLGTPTVKLSAYPDHNEVLSLNGTSQFVKLDSTDGLPTGNTPYTFEAWIKPAVMQNMTIIAIGNQVLANQGIRIGLTASNDLVVDWSGNSLSASVGDISENWHHVASTWDGTDRKLFLDGQEVAADQPANLNLQYPISLPLTVGSNGDTDFFQGAIDEFRAWTVALSPEDLDVYHDAIRYGDETGLFLYYRFEQSEVGNAEQVPDYVIGGIAHGLLVGNPQIDSSNLQVGYTDISVSDGSFSVNELPFGSGITYDLVPSGEYSQYKRDHEYEPVSQSVLLNPGNPQANAVDYTEYLPPPFDAYSSNVDLILNGSVNIIWSYIHDDSITGFDVFRETNPGALNGANLLPNNAEITTDFSPAPNGEFILYRLYSERTATHALSKEVPVFGRREADGRIEGKVVSISNVPLESRVCAFDDNEVLSLDGTDGYLDLQSLSTEMAGATAFSMEFWMQGSQAQQAGTVSLLSVSASDSSRKFGLFLGNDTIQDGRLYIYDGTLGSFSLADTALTGDDDWHFISYTCDSSGMGTLYVDGILRAQHNYSPAFLASDIWQAGRELTNTGGQHYLNGKLDELRIWTSSRDSIDIFESMPDILKGDEDSLIAYYRFTPEKEGILGNSPWVAVDYRYLSLKHITLGNGATIQSDTLAIGYCTYSDSTFSIPPDANYELDNIVYGTGTQFEVRPFRPGRKYDPSFRNISLNANTKTRINVNFVDTTIFTVSGFVQYNGVGPFSTGNCALDSVKICISPGPQNPNISLPNPNFTYTDSTGAYTFIIEEAGWYKLTPDAAACDVANPEFSPPEIEALFQFEQTGRNFVKVTQDTLRGSVLGACGNVFLDDAVIRITSPSSRPQNCVNLLHTVDNTGTFEVVLPRQDYQIVLEEANLNGMDIIENIRAQFDTTKLIHTEGDTTALNFVHRQPPKVLGEIPANAEWKPINCGTPQQDSILLLEQLVEYEWEFQLVHQYIYNNTTSSCPVDSGLVIITDNTREQAGGDSMVTDSMGSVTYYQQPERINLSPATGFSWDFNVGGPGIADSNKYDQPVVVEGARADSAQPFVTYTPALPELILRNPPGDGSYSFIENSHSTCREVGLSVLADNSFGFFTEAKFGASATLCGGGGLGVIALTCTEFTGYGGIGVDLDMGFRNVSTTKQERCVTMNTRIETSNSTYTGKLGTVIYGTGHNLLYSPGDEVFYDPDSCKMVKDRTIIFAPSGKRNGTEYIYQLGDIINVQIPTLEALLDEQFEQLDTTGNYVLTDTMQDLSNQIDVWNQVIAMVDRLDADALSSNVNNISFGGGITYSTYTETQQTNSEEIEFDLYLDNQFVFEAGFEAKGTGAFAGFRAGFRTKMSTSSSNTTSNNTTVTNTTGFLLTDDDSGDLFSVDIGSDNVYRTPVFDLIAGQSSCPHEPSTQPRDALDMTVNTTFVQVIPPATTGIIDLTLTNPGLVLADPSRTYYVAIDNSTNPDGAVVKVGGLQLGGTIAQQYTINSGATIIPEIRVTRDPMSAYTYDGLRLVAFAACDLNNFLLGGINNVNVLQEVIFSVQFESACTDITLLEPDENWIVNNRNGDTVDVFLTNYDASTISSMGVQLQHRQPGFSGGWIDITTISAADLMTFGPVYNYQWDVSTLQDGPYEFRARVNCINGFNYSDVRSGLIDRTSLLTFGIPEPSDGVLSPGDGISVAFTEDIYCFQAADSNASGFVEVRPGELQPVIFAINTPPGGCINNEISLAMQALPCLVEDREVTVIVDNLVDVTGNRQNLPAQWSFIVDMFTDPIVNAVITPISGTGASDGAIQVNPSGGLAPYTYSWFSGDTSKTRTGLAAGSYSVQVQDANCSRTTATFEITEQLACGNDPNEPNDTQANATDLSIGLLQNQFGSNDKLICESGDIDWFKIPVNSNGKTLSVILSNLPQNYDLEVYDSNGLIASSNNGIDSQLVVYQNVTADSTITIDSVMQIFGVTEQIHIPNTSAGTYYVRVFGAGGAWNAVKPYNVTYALVLPSNGQVGTKPSVSAPVIRNDDPIFKAYPNPASDRLNIAFESASIGKATLILRDLLGKNVQQLDLVAREGLNETVMNLADLPDGTYFIEAICGERRWKQKVVVVK